MKKLFLALLVAVTVAASAFAKDTKKVNYAASSNFKAEFANATSVTWTTTDQYTKAAFVVNNEKMEAFYNQSGEKIASSRTIAIDELPVKAKRSLAKDYAGYTVREAIEFEGIDDNGYFISAENEKESVVLKVNSTGGLNTFKTTKK
jgi:hypothetical protein